MKNTLLLVAWMAVLTWVLIVVASLLRARAWTGTGLQVAFGNRDTLPEPGALAGRAERTARNTLENFVLFAALALVAHAVQADAVAVARGATLFFWSRLAYVAVYYLGLAYVRTAIWLIGVVGLGMMVAAIVSR